MLHCARAALSPCSSKSRRHQVLANQPRSSWMRSGVTRNAPGSGVFSNFTVVQRMRWPGTSRAGMLREIPHLRDRHDEPAAPLADVRELGLDLVLQVPREDQDVVGTRLSDLFGRIDRNVGAGQELAVLVRIPVHGVFDEVRPDAAIVQERVSFSGSPVAGDGLSFLSGRDQEAEQVPLDPVDALGKGAVGLDPAEARLLLEPSHLADAGGLLRARASAVRGVDAERPAVRRKLLDVEEDEAVLPEDRLGGSEGEVGEMLVVDRVEPVSYTHL